MYKHHWIDIAEHKFKLPRGPWFESVKQLKAIETRHKPCYMYHVSKKPLGPSKSPLSKTVIKPQTIISSECELSWIKRFCVAPTVEQCLVAIAQDAWYHERFYIYRTVRKQSSSYIPKGVYDAPITQERWITRPVTVQLVGELIKEKESDGNIQFSEEEWYSLDTENRGSEQGACFRIQMLELSHLKKLFKKYEQNIFYNDKETNIHKSQRELRLRINRG